MLHKIENNEPDSVSTILGRVKLSDRESPITVFEYHKKLYSVFTRTIRTQLQLQEGYYHHIGDFHKELDIGVVEKKLERALV